MQYDTDRKLVALEAEIARLNDRIAEIQAEIAMLGVIEPPFNVEQVAAS